MYNEYNENLKNSVTMSMESIASSMDNEDEYKRSYGDRNVGGFGESPIRRIVKLSG